jgi:hypothetical protein
MRRTVIFAIAALTGWPMFGLAQQGSPSGPRLESPGEISVWSTVLTQKQDYCWRQAMAQKLSYWKRRRFVRACVKREAGAR